MYWVKRFGYDCCVTFRPPPQILRHWIFYGILKDEVLSAKPAANCEFTIDTESSNMRKDEMILNV